jgi:hypothetical protein
MDWSLYYEQQQLCALKYNSERHFQTNDSSFDQNYSPFNEHQKNKVSDLKCELASQIIVKKTGKT